MAETTLPSFAPGTLDARIDDPTLAAAVAAAIARADDERWAERLHERDTTLWSADPAVQEKIGSRLGWLDLPADFSDQVPALEAFGETIRDQGFTAAIVAGMGGSSLAPEVIARAFGDIEDWLTIRILDSTDPEAVAAAWDGLDPLATLFIVGTKSGTTTETLAFAADARQRIHDGLRVHGVRSESPGDFMAAVTDPGKSLAAIPHHEEMSRVFLNPESVGGRYSALSYVGLLPASLAGVDLDPFMTSAVAMHGRCTNRETAANPGVALGATLGALATAGRDKLTFVVDPALGPLGAWLEQLIAESTGKLGKGIVPVDREPLGTPTAYGNDRVFVRIALEGAEPPAAAADGTSADALLEALAAAGHPVLRFSLADPIDLAAEFLRWEVATAVAGIVLTVNPFDEPNVTESKENTKRVLEELERHGAFPHEEPLATGDGLALYGDTALAGTSPSGPSSPRPPPVPRPSTASGLACVTQPAARRPAGSAPATSTPPASSTRAARPSAGSSSSPPTIPPTSPSTASTTRSASSSTPRRAATWRHWRRTSSRCFASTSDGMSTPASPPSTPRSPPLFVSNSAPFVRADAQAQPEGGIPCESASSASGGWAPTWSAASSGTATRWWRSTGLRRGRARS